MITHAILKPEIEDVIKTLIETCDEIYLVGGAIRDYLLKNSNHDIDFVVKKNALKAARISADRLRGKYYVLDQQRETGRTLLEIDGEQIILDFATINGEDISTDLKLRDFTVNAIAINMAGPDVLFDPLNGERDLSQGILRPCNPASFSQDPVRTIRAVRFQQRMNLKLEEGSVALIQAAAPQLASISAERKRDELFQVFETDHIRESCELLRTYQLWDAIFPLLSELGQLKQVPHHVHTLEGHTLQVLDYCQLFLNFLKNGQMKTSNEFLKQGCNLLGAYRADLLHFLMHPIHPQRQYDGLLFLAVLYHDLGKVKIDPVEVNGKIGFPEHAQLSADLFCSTCSHWALSKDENRFVERIIRNHTLPDMIQGTVHAPSRRALYQFFQKAGSAGVFISIFHLADIMAAYEDRITPERWGKAINTCQTLLDCWFRKYNQIVAPPVFITGDDLINQFGMQSGPRLGRMLAGIQEEQAAGEILNREMAVDYIERRLKEG